MTDIDDKLAALRVKPATDYWTDARVSAAEIIPLTSDAWQQLSVTLEDLPLVLTIRWNETASGWFMDLASVDETIDVKGLRLSPGVDMLDGLTITELGKMYITDLQNANAEPTFDGLIDRFMLWYLPLSAV